MSCPRQGLKWQWADRRRCPPCWCRRRANGRCRKNSDACASPARFWSRSTSVPRQPRPSPSAKRAAPTLPDRNRFTGKLGRAVLCIFKELEAPLLGTIEPEDNSFAECGRLVLVSERHPALQIANLRRRDVL